MKQLFPSSVKTNNQKIISALGKKVKFTSEAFALTSEENRKPLREALAAAYFSSYRYRLMAKGQFPKRCQFR